MSLDHSSSFGRVGQRSANPALVKFNFECLVGQHLVLFNNIILMFDAAFHVLLSQIEFLLRRGLKMTLFLNIVGNRPLNLRCIQCLLHDSRVDICAIERSVARNSRALEICELARQFYSFVIDDDEILSLFSLTRRRQPALSSLKVYTISI